MSSTTTEYCGENFSYRQQNRDIPTQSKANTQYSHQTTSAKRKEYWSRHVKRCLRGICRQRMPRSDCASKQCPLDICGQRWPRSDCADAQSDQGLRGPLIELFDTVQVRYIAPWQKSSVRTTLLADLEIYCSHIHRRHIFMKRGSNRTNSHTFS